MLYGSKWAKMHVANQQVHVHCVHVHLPVGLTDVGNFVPHVNKKSGYFGPQMKGYHPEINFLKRLMSPILSIFWHLVTQCLYFFLPVHDSRDFGSILQPIIL